MTTLPQFEPLHAVGRIRLATHQRILDAGGPGFSCQAHVWLNGRADAEALRRALARLVRRHPYFTARIETSGRQPGWRFTNAECPLVEAALDRDDDAAVLEYAQELMAAPHHLDRENPICFHLVRRPSAADTFVIQYSHVLMDSNAAKMIIRELDELACETEPGIAPRFRAGDPVAAYLNRFPLRRRIRAAFKTARHMFRRSRTCGRSTVRLNPAAGEVPGSRNKMLARTLTADESRRIHARVRKLCGFGSISMGLLASVLRAVHQMSGQTPSPEAYLGATIGMGLASMARDASVADDVVSSMLFNVATDELADRDALVVKLHREFREQLSREYDLGYLQLASWIRRRSLSRRRISPGRKTNELRSLAYGYFGKLTDGSQPFCGATIDRAYSMIYTLMPPGVAFTGNECGDRLTFGMTYAPETLTTAQAKQLFDLLVEDLIAEPVRHGELETASVNG